MSPSGRTIAAAVVAALVAGGATAWVMQTRAPGSERSVTLQSTTPLPPEGAAALVPLGDLAGSAETTLPASLANPLKQDASAVNEGKRLFAQMNCAGCHGYTAKGGMGPDLTDTHWRYGGTPVQIYKSIFEGRPQGMPAWGRALPSHSIWQLTSYIESLGGSFPADAYHAGQQGDLAGQASAAESGEPPADNGGNHKPAAGSGSQSQQSGKSSGAGGSHP
ncbi:c-type cytochrome [Sphingomonas sp. KRR8]|uniref:c-type cytochrome n=1 Tax=Sphingomonas sp. KRR8 TaxID=2942996 RepID=UPI00202292EA|nr:c-type cytochrome [Sphingomonas sp. KRR8]URD61843.1 c-type cytochrome [Sphingomonas sp. KRR8]